MNRPGFTVETTDGKNFDANHLTICWDHGWIVTFICSGILEQITSERIKEVRFANQYKGPSYCNECDGPIPFRD